MTDTRDGSLEAIPVALLRDPLDFLLADHFRQRVLCNLLEELADGPSLDRPLAARIVDHLQNDMAVHIIDEEEDLFPLLRRRCAIEDDIGTVLGALAGEHADEGARSGTIIGELSALLVDPGAFSVPEPLAALLRAFAAGQRRHLAVENGVVLPIARLRLLPTDLHALSRRMAARRGVHLGTGEA